MSIRLFLPDQWPMWAALALLRCIVWLPHRARLWVGRQLGRALRPLFHKRRRIARINLNIAFPERTPEARETLLARHFESLGIGLVESALAWWAAGRRLRPLARIEGLEHLRAALARGRGALLVSGHFTTLEIGGRLLALFADLDAVYRHQNAPLFDRCMERGRRGFLGRLIHRSDVRGLLRALRDNRAVWYAADQRYTGPHGVFARFFGRPAASNGAIHRIAAISGAAVLPYFPIRLPDGGGYRLRLLPPLEGFPGAGAEEDIQRILALVEETARASPEQYMWVQSRFKYGPQGAANPYAERDETAVADDAAGARA